MLEVCSLDMTQSPDAIMRIWFDKVLAGDPGSCIVEIRT